MAMMLTERPRSTPTRRPRIEGLDALRGLAATSVMLYHYTAWYGHDGNGHVPPGVLVSFGQGGLGVDLFFIISGFVIFMTLENTSNMYRFVTSRFARLYPAFIACMLLTIAITHVLHYAHVYPTLIITNLTMVPGLFGYSGIDGAYWTLLYELVFYGLAALAVLGMQWRRPELPCFVWLVIVLVMQLIGLDRLPGQIHTLPVPLIPTLIVAPYANLFIIGIILYRLHTGHRTWQTYLLLGFALAMSVGDGPQLAFKALSVPLFPVIIAGFAAIVWLAVADWLPILHAAPLKFLGRISYPLYLIHGAAGYAVIRRLETDGVSANFAVATTMVLAVMLAWAVSDLVEWPARRQLLRLFAMYGERRLGTVTLVGEPR